jgi:N-methylhydantoinase A/oxoprolinase/acetone carboxylase beta subunit
MKTEQTNRLSADIGGTFTDLVLETPQGRLHHQGADHSPPARSKGVIDGIDQVLSTAGVAHDSIGIFVHGTTLATNALIEPLMATFLTTRMSSLTCSTTTPSSF